MCTAIVCSPGCDVKNFKINLIFLIKLFLYISKSQKKNVNILATSKTWTQTSQTLDPDTDPEKSGPRKTWTLKNLEPEKPGPLKTWTQENLDPEKRGL